MQLFIRRFPVHYRIVRPLKITACVSSVVRSSAELGAERDVH